MLLLSISAFRMRNPGMWHKVLGELKAFVLRCSVNVAAYAARETSASTHHICVSLNTAFLKMLIAIFNNYFISSCFELVHN